MIFMAGEMFDLGSLECCQDGLRARALQAHATTHGYQNVVFRMLINQSETYVT